MAKRKPEEELSANPNTIRVRRYLATLSEPEQEYEKAKNRLRVAISRAKTNLRKTPAFHNVIKSLQNGMLEKVAREATDRAWAKGTHPDQVARNLGLALPGMREDISDLISDDDEDAADFESRPTLPCTHCATRKYKCDRQRPCRACDNHAADCIYVPPPPPQRTRRLAQVQPLTERLSFHDRLLQENRIDTRTPHATPPQQVQSPVSSSPGAVTGASTAQAVQQQTPSSVVPEPKGTVSRTQLVKAKGRSVLVDNSLMSRVLEEVNISESGSDEESGAEASEHDFDYILQMQPRANSKPQHPSPERITQVWQVFLERVNPLTKAVHVPTVTMAIQKAASNTTGIPRCIEALLFAIYSTAVMSLDDAECRQKLGEPRKKLLSHYVEATKKALSRAGFMSTSRLVVLQALILHILSVRDIEPRALWSLTGVAMRIAQGMGLERDGACLGLPPFETEMRRRVWWMLKMLDRQVAERCGLVKFRDLDVGPESTKRPTNVNDDQLQPGMTLPPAASNRLTDMAFVALRYELAELGGARFTKFRQEGKDPATWEQDLASRTVGDEPDFRKEMEDLIETKYLRYCDPSQPLHLITMLMGRSALNTIRFLTHHPRRWSSIEQTPPSERELVWDVSIKLLEQHTMLQTIPQLRRFAWHAATVMQWHAFIHILDTLRLSPLNADGERAWELVRQTFENMPALMSDTKKPIYLAVGSLCLKAYDARKAALPQNGLGVQLVPHYIGRLRQRRDKARAKQRAREAQSSQTESIPTSVVQDHDRTTKHPESAQVDHVARPQSPVCHATATADEHSWFDIGFGDSYGVEMNGAIDVESALAQNMDFGNGLSQTIVWTQWDAWLAESIAMLSYDVEFGSYL